ncbi:hypothetical protein PM082_013336 [Marasmius tenuissimus]|nr:hypothetical protein PM082_013336 [Marasmius tenuissimus]
MEIGRKPVGLVVTPTKGLANNIVMEMGYLGLSAFAYTHDNITKARKSGINMTEKITNCNYNIVCVDPEHLREPEWWKIMNLVVFRSNMIYGCAEEGHLINEWGSTFQPIFRQIGTLFTGRLPSAVSRFSITATLQPGHTTSSVCSSLSLQGPSFSFIRRSNERPNTKIIVGKLISPSSGTQFPELLPYLNCQRKIVIHTATIKYRHRIFLYLFSALRHTMANPLHRI